MFILEETRGSKVVWYIRRGVVVLGRMSFNLTHCKKDTEVRMQPLLLAQKLAVGRDR